MRIQRKLVFSGGYRPHLELLVFKKVFFLIGFVLSWSFCIKEQEILCFFSGGLRPQMEILVFMGRLGRDHIPTFLQIVHMSGLEMTS